MAGLTVRGGRQVVARDDAAALPSLLDFHSPTGALSVAPVLFAARGTTWVVCSLVAACFAAAGLIPIDKVVTAQGKVIAENPTSVIQPLETAIVRSIDVREGQLVKRGDLLARLDPTFATADAGALEAQVDSYQSEVDRLNAEAGSQPYRPSVTNQNTLMQSAIFAQRKAETEFKLQNYAQKIASIQSQIQRAMSDVTAYSSRLQIATEVESKRIELEKDKVGSALNRLSATDSKLEVMRGMEGAKAQAVQGARDLAAMQAERDGYVQNQQSAIGKDLTDATRKLSDARENLNKAVLRRRLVEMRAEQDSIVLNVAKVSPGSVLQSGEQLMSLTPADSPLEVEVNIAGADAGFVRQGDPVTIKLDAFPYTQYGGASGTVRIVSPDSFTTSPDDKKRGVTPGGPQAGPTFFIGRVTIEETSLHDTPPGFRLQPGMPATLDVKVGKRTVLDYMLGHVLPVAMDGMREP